MQRALQARRRRLCGLLSDAARCLFASAIVMALGLSMGHRPDGGLPGVLACAPITLRLYARQS